MKLWELDPTSRAVMLAVLRQGPVSRGVVARRMGLSSGSITRLTRPLIDLGMLEECPPQPHQIGRPSVPLLVADEAALFFGVKVVPGALHTVVTGLRGVVRHQSTLPADTSSADSTAAAISSMVGDPGAANGVTAIGISLAAAVARRGKLRAVDFLGWSGGNLSKLVARHTGLPCVSANDVNALTLAEHWFGHGRGTHDFAVLTIGEGVGAGVVSRDEPMLGNHGAGPMLGATWLADGRPFHTVLTSASIAAAASAVAEHAMTHAEALESHDRRVMAVLDDAANALGYLAALTAIAYDPQRILLTGDGIGLVDGRMDIVHSVLEQHQFFDIGPPELVVGEHDFFDWAVGAASLAIRLVLST